MKVSSEKIYLKQGAGRNLKGFPIPFPSPTEKSAESQRG